MADKSYQEINFHEGLVESDLSFEEKCTTAFRQIIPDKKIGVTNYAIHLYNCRTCNPIQHLVITGDLLKLKQGSKTPFILAVRVDIRVL